MDRSAARRWWPVAAGVVLGVLAGVPVALAGQGTRKAEAKVLISSPAGGSAIRPSLPNLRELAASGVVAGNVKSTLRLPESTEALRRRLHARIQPQSEVIVIAATDGQAEKARQVAQEAAVVFAQLVGARFGAAKPALQAAVLDSAHVLAGPDRHFLRNGLIGALAGLLAGSAAFFLLAGEQKRAPAGAGVDDRALKRREQLVEARLKNVAERERALASRAGQLAARERALEERAKAPPAPPPEPPAAPPPRPEPGPVPAPARRGSWNLNDLQRAVDAHAATSPERAEEMRTYLFFLRDHAGSDGSLPTQFDGLVLDVFGELDPLVLERSAET